MITKKSPWRFSILAVGSLTCFGMAAATQAQNRVGVELDLIDKAEFPQKVEPETDKPGPVEFFPRLSKSEAQIVKTLDAPSEVSFQETPLTEALTYLRHMHRIEIWIDDVRVGQDLTVTLDTSGTTLRSCLNRLLEPRDLAYLIEDDVLKVTTKQAASAKIVTRTYPVRDLVDTPAAAQELLQILMHGLGLLKNPDENQTLVMTGKSRVLIVRQTHQVHDQLLQLLRDLREANALPVQATDVSGTAKQNPNGTGKNPEPSRDGFLEPFREEPFRESPFEDPRARDTLKLKKNSKI